MLKLYENIKQKRLEHGLTQDELAKKLGYADKSMIAKVEAGKIDLSISKITAFAKVLNTTPQILMGWDEPEPQTLSQDEAQLVNNYRQLNDDGKEKFLDHSIDLVASGRYEKNNIAKMVHEA